MKKYVGPGTFPNYFGKSPPSYPIFNLNARSSHDGRIYLAIPIQNDARQRARPFPTIYRLVIGHRVSTGFPLHAGRVLIVCRRDRGLGIGLLCFQVQR